MSSKLWLIIVNKLFCSHEWKSHWLKEGSIYEDGAKFGERPIAFYRFETLICTKCGKIKKDKTIVK